MGFKKRLEKQLLALSNVPNHARQKRRDKLNKAGVHVQKQRAAFDMNTRATEKRHGCSAPPRGL